MASLAAEYQIEIKCRRKSSKPWNWEIYRKGGSLPVKRSGMFYSSRMRAERNGMRALERIRGGLGGRDPPLIAA
jgi:hypothetical protein